MVPLSQVEDFNARIEQVRSLELSGHCTPGEGIADLSPSAAYSPDFRPSLTETAGSRKSVIVGEIIASEPALDLVTHQIATLFHLRIQQVIRNRDSLAAGDIVTFYKPWGSATVRGVTLCSLPGGARASDGAAIVSIDRDRQTMLLLGRLASGNNNFFEAYRHEQFQLIDGQVYYQPAVAQYRDCKPELLDSLVVYFRTSSP